MKVFIAGGSGVVGRHLIPALAAAGHEVVATTTSRAKAERIEEWGARAVELDLLDRDAVLRSVADAAPEVVVHQATALSRPTSLRRFDRTFADTNRLRTVGLDNLLEAAKGAGAKQFVAQSFTGWPNERRGGRVKTEADPLDPNPPAAARATLWAIRHLEDRVESVEGMTGVVLRYGSLYGPGTALGEGGELLELVRRGRIPLVGAGSGIWSFVHVTDAADATRRAIEAGVHGLFNVVDDEPAPVAEWLPYLARVVGRSEPRRVPTWFARLLIGEQGIAMMTEMRGSSNERAKRELGWQLLFPSWRQGFVDGLGLAADDKRRAA